MVLVAGYGRFAAAVNSQRPRRRAARLVALSLLALIASVIGVVPGHAQATSGFATPEASRAHAPTGKDGAAVRLAVLGDSLAAGYGVKPDEAIPARLEAALRAEGRNVEVLNQGVSGDTTAGGLARLDWMLADKPDIVLVELGANDALRGLDPAQAERNLEAIVTRLKAEGVTVWLAGMMAPRNLGADYVRQFDGLYRRLADRNQVPLYPFILEGVAQDAVLNQPDGIHPNPKGVDVVVQHLLPFVTHNLDSYAASVRRPARP